MYVYLYISTSTVPHHLLHQDSIPGHIHKWIMCVPPCISKGAPIVSVMFNNQKGSTFQTSFVYSWHISSPQPETHTPGNKVSVIVFPTYVPKRKSNLQTSCTTIPNFHSTEQCCYFYFRATFNQRVCESLLVLLLGLHGTCPVINCGQRVKRGWLRVGAARHQI